MKVIAVCANRGPCKGQGIRRKIQKVARYSCIGSNTLIAGFQGPGSAALLARFHKQLAKANLFV